MTTARCACGGTMDRGFLFVTHEGTNLPVTWVEGEVERSRVTRSAKIKGRTQHPVVALRCRSCGTLDLGTPEGKPEGAA